MTEVRGCFVAAPLTPLRSSMATSQNASTDALFVGYEDQENLGLRSIIAALQAHGFRTRLEAFTPRDSSGILTAAQKYHPHLIGFSIIFQYTFDEFTKLMERLREADIKAHFTVGGHFPSLCPREVLEAVPHIDSVVRCEGEYTTLELLQNLHQPNNWTNIKGLAFRRDSQVIINPSRPLVVDLDSLHLPVRSNPRSMPRNIRVASMLASRGCLYNCSFCSIRQFYGLAPGPLRRTRSPQAVAAEMKELYKHNHVQFFIFQDDDFTSGSSKQRQWIEEFLFALNKEDLSGHITWKIACRVDDIEEDILIKSRDRGLIAVYLGVESGNARGLQTLNKHVTLEQNLSAIEILKRIDLTFEMGFMLLDPDSTIGTVRENIEFLRHVTADGSCCVNFCKMLPYSGTPIEERLRKEGRLMGSLSQPNYNFLDPRLDWYEFFLSETFHFRNFDILGIAERLRTARIDCCLARALKHDPQVDEYERVLRELTVRANTIALDALDYGLSFIKSRDIDRIPADWPILDYFSNQKRQMEAEIQLDLDRVLATYNPEMLRVYADEFSRRFEEAYFDVS